MNKTYVIWNLREAQHEIERTIAQLDATPDYCGEEYVVAITHVYHHLNTAWNARDASDQAANTCSQSDFHKWRQFPSTEEIVL